MPDKPINFAARFEFLTALDALAERHEIASGKRLPCLSSVFENHCPKLGTARLGWSGRRIGACCLVGPS